MENLSEFLKDVENDINTMSRINTQLSKNIEQRNNELIKDTLSCKEYCKLYKITEPTLIKRRKLGLIAHFKLGKNFYYLKNEGGQNV